MNPQNPRSYSERALALLLVGEKTRDRQQLTRALDDCQQAIALAGADAMNHRILAEAFQLLARNDEAIKSATEAIRLDPEDPLAFLARASAYLGREENDKAIADVDQALRLEAEGGLPYLLRGLAYAKQKKEDKARADLAKAAQINPKMAEVKEAYERELAQEKGLRSFQMEKIDFKMPDDSRVQDMVKKDQEQRRNEELKSYFTGVLVILAIPISVLILAAVGALVGRLWNMVFGRR